MPDEFDDMKAHRDLKLDTVTCFEILLPPNRWVGGGGFWEFFFGVVFSWKIIGLLRGGIPRGGGSLIFPNVP